MVRRCVTSLKQQTTIDDTEIIIVDNDSSDEDKNNLRKIKDVLLVFSTSNLGYGQGCNLGVKNATGDLICILNPDTVLSPDTLEKWAAEFSTLKTQYIDLALLAPTLRNENGNIQRSTYRFLSPLNYWFYHSIFAGMIKKIKKSIRFHNRNCQNNQVLEVDWAMGSAYLIDKAAWDKVGGFSDKFFMYAEDEDLCYRFRSAGYRILYTGNVSLTHTQGEPSAHNRAKGIISFFDGLSRYIDLHYTAPMKQLIILQVIVDMCIRILLADFMYLFKPKDEMTRSRLRGYIEVIKAYWRKLL